MKSLKPKRCAASKCRKTFTPRSGLQCVCSPRCAVEFTREREAKKKRRESRAWTRVQLEGMKTKPMLMKEAQSEFNKYIRARDRYRFCISCGKAPKSEHLTGGSIDCGHYRSIGSSPEHRFDEDNAHGQCKHCNRHRSGDVVHYRIGLMLRIGLNRVDELERNHEMPNWTRDDLRNIRDHYRARANELRRSG